MPGKDEVMQNGNIHVITPRGVTRVECGKRRERETKNLKKDVEIKEAEMGKEDSKMAEAEPKTSRLQKLPRS
jgi:hypothetical protein